MRYNKHKFIKIKVLLFISLSIFSLNSFSCGELPSGFNNCDFSIGDVINPTRINQEMTKLENIANEKTDLDLNLKKDFLSGEPIIKEDLKNNLELIQSIGQQNYNINFSNNILSSEVSNEINNAFSHIKSIEYNMATSPSFIGYSQEGLNSWKNYTPSILNDGFTGYTGAQNYTEHSALVENISRGIVFNFNKNIILKTIVLFYIGNSAVGNWNIQCWNGSWISLKTVTMTGNSGVPITFNEDGNFSCSKYRIQISAWTPAGTNMYLFEAQAFKYLK